MLFVPQLEAQTVPKSDYTFHLFRKEKEDAIKNYENYLKQKNFGTYMNQKKKKKSSENKGIN